MDVCKVVQQVAKVGDRAELGTASIAAMRAQPLEREAHDGRRDERVDELGHLALLLARGHLTPLAQAGISQAYPMHRRHWVVGWSLSSPPPPPPPPPPPAAAVAVVVVVVCRYGYLGRAGATFEVVEQRDEGLRDA